MKPSIVAKLEALHERHEEVQALLGDAQTIADQERFRALSREYAQLSDVSRCFTAVSYTHLTLPTILLV